MVRKRPAAKAVKAESEQEEQNASEEVKEQDEGDQGFEEPVQQAEQPEGRPNMAQKKDTMAPKQKVLEVLNRTVDKKLQNLSQRDRLFLRPLGCTKCRFRYGCTRSCWLGHGFLD